MSREQNIRAQESFGDAVNGGKLDAIKTVVAAKFVDHDPAPDQAPGPEELINFFTELRRAFPDLNICVEYLVADDHNVCFAYTITGTHNGPFHGAQATGKKIKARGMQIGRFEGGKMVERWGSSDQLGILQQIGKLPS